MEPTICITNSSHAVILSDHLQEENICLLNQHAWSLLGEVIFTQQLLISASAWGLDVQFDAAWKLKKDATVKYCSDSSEEQCQLVASNND